MPRVRDIWQGCGIMFDCEGCGAAVHALGLKEQPWHGMCQGCARAQDYPPDLDLMMESSWARTWMRKPPELRRELRRMRA